MADKTHNLTDILHSTDSGRDGSVSTKRAAKDGANYTVTGTKAEQEKLSGILDDMGKAGFGEDLLAEAGEFTIAYEAGMRSAGVCSKGKNILLNPALSHDEQILTLAHEMRHVGQHNRGLEIYAGENILTQTKKLRAGEADAEVSGARVAWELKEKGITGPWDSFEKENPEIAKPFAQEVAKTGKAGNAAMQAGFKGWYSNTARMESYDRSTFDFVMHMASNNNRLDGCFADNTPNDDIGDKICAVSSKRGGLAGLVGLRKSQGNYLTDTAFLDSDKATTMGHSVHGRLKAFFAGRGKRMNINETSMDKIPTHGDVLKPMMAEFNPKTRAESDKNGLESQAQDLTKVAKSQISGLSTGEQSHSEHDYVQGQIDKQYKDGKVMLQGMAVSEGIKKIMAAKVGKGK